MIAQPQCAHRGASAWIAHSKESKTCVSPRTLISIACSYSFPHVSHLAMCVAYPACTRSFADALQRMRLGEADLPAQVRLVAAPALLVGDRDERRDRHRLLVLAERDHGQERRAGVPHGAALDVLGL